MTELICIVCPVGCRLQVDEENGYKVTGNACNRGIKYGQEELINPSRVITSTVRIHGAPHRRLPVRTDGPIPKGKIVEAMAQIRTHAVHSPVRIGDVLLDDLVGTGVRLIATRDM